MHHLKRRPVGRNEQIPRLALARVEPTADGRRASDGSLVVLLAATHVDMRQLTRTHHPIQEPAVREQLRGDGSSELLPVMSHGQNDTRSAPARTHAATT